MLEDTNSLDGAQIIHTFTFSSDELRLCLWESLSCKFWVWENSANKVSNYMAESQKPRTPAIVVASPR